MDRDVMREEELWNQGYHIIVNRLFLETNDSEILGQKSASDPPPVHGD